jgi:O-antigen/teichoic acid export membrane protein
MSRRVALNAVWNVGGTMSSVVVGLVALPVLLHALGAAKLGIFTLALGLIGFSGLFDLGLGRALTQSVSSMLGQGRPPEAVAAIVAQVLRLLAIFGLVWLIILWLLAPEIVEQLFSLRGDLADETIFGLRAVALSIPFALVGTGAMGSLEGLQRFRELSTWRSALSVLQFGSPTLVALWRPDVGLVIAALAVNRILTVSIWLRVLRQALPFQSDRRYAPEDLRHLLRFGGWLSISNVIAPLMAYADRFYLASMYPPASVALYTVSYDSLFRFTAIPYAAFGAMFPALSQAQSRPDGSLQMVRLGLILLVAFTLPPLLVATILSKPLLSLWLGQSFAIATLPIFQILIVGVFLNCTAHIPYALLQAHGRSDLTAKLHLFELPIFIFLLIWGVSTWGVVGVALATTLRIALDTIALYVSSIWLQPAYAAILLKGVGIIVLASAALVLPLMSKKPLLLLLDAVVALPTCVSMLVNSYLEWRKPIIRVSST